MTSETGSRRHPTDKIAEIPLPSAIASWEPEEGWTHHRTLDPVRGAALTAAVSAYRYAFDWPDDSPTPPDDTTTEILTMATQFERYLTGEEANATAD